MTYIIGEIGSNWATDDDIVLSISRAKSAGASAVKLQLFNETDLYGPVADFERRCEPNIELAHQRCQELGMGFLCSVFNPSLVDYVNRFVKMHKIASAEMCDVDLLKAVAATGKPVILSTGGHTLAEIHQALDVLGPARHRTTLLYCESAYPSNRYMPEKLALLERSTGLPVGISDHSREVYLTAWMADHFAAPIVEKHVNLCGATGPDAPHSLDEEEFREFCSYLNNRHFLVSDVLSPNEVDMVVQHNRRLVTTCDVPRGAVLVKGINFGSYRGLTENAHALSPFEAGRVNGKIAARHIKAGEAICDGDICAKITADAAFI